MRAPSLLLYPVSQLLWSLSCHVHTGRLIPHLIIVDFTLDLRARQVPQLWTFRSLVDSDVSNSFFQDLCEWPATVRDDIGLCGTPCHDFEVLFSIVSRCGDHHFLELGRISSSSSCLRNAHFT